MKKNHCEVFVVEHSTGIEQGCKTCRQVLHKGNFAIGITVHEHGSDSDYILGMQDQPVHCGETKEFIQTFKTEALAEAEKLRVVEHISQKGTTEGLLLLSFFLPNIN